ncbi:MAG: glycosyltransferase [Pirellulales bacterium]|nr:glycosyltransferase [Pirellulales bacterium]
MANLRATIAFVPREVFSTTQRSLETLYERTQEPFDLVCVDGGSPPAVQQYLQQAARAKGFTLLRTDHYLSPNQARNLAAAEARTAHVVFVDNDVLVTSSWLTKLVDCAEETGAWVVGPAYFEHLPECHKLHMYGGECRIEVNPSGRRQYYEKHHLAHMELSSLDQPLKRCETELIEFHTVLVQRKAFEVIGPLDEGLSCHSEHGDLCMMVRNAGGRVFLEPESQITYVPPRRLEREDREFFFLRWSEAWATANARHMAQKWDLDRTNVDNGRGSVWIGEHRRYGLATLAKMRRLIGPKMTRSIEKRIATPLERWVNRWRYPASQYGTLPTPNVRVAYRPQVRVAAAAA